MRHSVPRAIGLAILVAGTLDIADALIFYGVRYHVSPKLLLQSIASHVTGREVFHGGVPTAFAGLVVHFLITTFWVTLFILAARRLHVLFTRPIASGIVYGLFIYVFMTYVILPNVTLPTHASHVFAIVSNAVLALVLFMGLPIALINAHFAPQSTAPNF